MFGLVLAIGIVVDDAIVVVEAVIHHLEHGLSPKEAIKAMSEVSGPVIGIALILSAVFIPVALLGGLVGSMYKQFALTIAISVLLSAFNAVLTPALCAMMLKEPKPMRGPLGAFFRGFNKVFDVTTNGYVNVRDCGSSRNRDDRHRGRRRAGRDLSRERFPPVSFRRRPGIFGVNVQLPPGASLARTSEVLKKVEKSERLKGSNRIKRSAATGRHQHLPAKLRFALCALETMGRAHGEALHVKGIMASLQRNLQRFLRRDRFNIPTLSGFGAASGFNFLVQDRTGTMTVEQLGEQVGSFIAAGGEDPNSETSLLHSIQTIRRSK